MMSTSAQIEANRANAQLSSGPKTPEGKAKSSLNAVKTGLTGRTVLLPGDDAAAYQQLVARCLKEHQPATDAERDLVQSISDTQWRLLRIPALEMGVYAIGRLELAGKFENEEDPAARSALIEAQVFIAYQRQLNNLSIQEGRLRKQRERDLDELEQMQKERKERTRKQIATATQLYEEAEENGEPFDPAQFGFEISTVQILHNLAFNAARRNGYSHAAAEALARKAA